MNMAYTPASQTFIDPALLRRALGAFVTGVTVVTTRGPGGTPVGITVNSFNAVSLDPPLVLWSLSVRAVSFDAFLRSSHFAVNVLCQQQVSVSERFAMSGGDKFNGMNWRPGLADMPLLDGTAASFTCRTVHRYPGGDHLIFVGEVIDFERSTLAPLAYAEGSYAELGKSLRSERYARIPVV